MAVDVIAVGVGVAREIEPLHGHALAVMRRVEQTIDLLLVGVGRLVGEERRDLFGSGRQAGEVEGDAAEQGDAVGFGRGLQAFGFEPGEDEVVDRIRDPRGVLHRRHGGPDRARRRPSAFPISRLRRSIP